MTYNIRFDDGSDGPGRWGYRRELIAQLIDYHAADVIGLQEALLNQLDDLQQLLPGFSWIGEGREGGTRGEHCAILYRTSRLLPLESGTFWLSPHPDEPGSKGWDAALPRITTWARLRDISSHQEFYLFNTHLDHEGRIALKESSRLLEQKVKSIAGSSAAVIIGDFIFGEESEEYEYLTSNWSDAYSAASRGSYGADATYYGGEVEVSSKPGVRLDYIFLQRVSPIRHAILTDSWRGRFPSDHLPVLAVIDLALSYDAGSAPD